nr:GNAT family N-acetyltransferase [Streptomyces sp. SID8379]
MTDRLDVAPSATAPALVLRRWNLADAAELIAVARDAALRRWAPVPVDDEASARRWIRAQERGWETGERLAFAVTEPRVGDGAGLLAGYVVLKRAVPDAPSAEVGYWTAAHARGRAVAPRALDALTRWAFDAFAGEGLRRLELFHSASNEASCRVAQKSGFAWARDVPPLPPEFPEHGHLHVHPRGPAASR